MSKTVKTRDSAVAVLRKLGIKKADYNKFVAKVENGFQVAVTKAKEFLASPAAKPAGKKAKVKPAKVAKEKGPTVTSVVEGLILEGKSNADAWAVIKEQFKLSDDKRWYPSWFRSRLKRNGKLSSKKEA